MRRALQRFDGTLSELRKVVSMTHLRGKWNRMPAGFWRYKCATGAILNWWKSTGTYNIQGPPTEAARLRRAVTRALRTPADND